MTLDKLTAHVKDGRIVVDQPTDLPEGTELHLVVVDEIDELDVEEQAALEEHLRLSIEEADRGELIPFEDVLAELRARNA